MLVAHVPVYDSGCGRVGVHDGVLRVEDMHHFDTTHAQDIGDERAMATPPQRFSAHERCALASAKLDQLAQTARKLRAFHVVGVATKGRVAPGDIRRIRTCRPPAAEGGKPVISDAMFRKRLL